MVLKRLIVFTALLMLPAQGFAQNGGRWQVMAVGGVFSPAEDEIQNIYGDGVAGEFALALPLGASGRLKLGLDRFQRDGDPFYKADDFNAGNAADLSLTGISLALQSHALTRSFPRLYFGAGIDYVFGREEIAGQKASTGGAIGAHVAVMPEIRLNSRLSLLAEARYRFLEMTFKNGRDRYRFDLSGASLLLGLGYRFGQ
ncbi:MAG: hypothetical protein ACE5IY_08415 [bacterium]